VPFDVAIGFRARQLAKHRTRGWLAR
jgi:hypothetical protein